VPLARGIADLRKPNRRRRHWSRQPSQPDRGIDFAEIDGQSAPQAAHRGKSAHPRALASRWVPIPRPDCPRHLRARRLLDAREMTVMLAEQQRQQFVVVDSSGRVERPRPAMMAVSSRNLSVRNQAEVGMRLPAGEVRQRSARRGRCRPGLRAKYARVADRRATPICRPRPPPLESTGRTRPIIPR